MPAPKKDKEGLPRSAQCLDRMDHTSVLMKIYLCGLVQTCRSLMEEMEKFIDAKKVRKGGGDLLPGSSVCN